MEVRRALNCREPRRPEIPVLALEAFAGEELKLKQNVGRFCNDESLESEKGLGKGWLFTC